MWLAGDHQGTSSWSVNSRTLTSSVKRQDPYGGPRVHFDPDYWPVGQRGFVGGTEDPTGLVQLGARSYDPELGMFLSVDPLGVPTDPQRMHPYAYSNNNPLTFSDASGLGYLEPGGHGCTPGPGGTCGTSSHINNGANPNGINDGPASCHAGCGGGSLNLSKSSGGTAPTPPSTRERLEAFRYLLHERLRDGKIESYEDFRQVYRDVGLDSCDYATWSWGCRHQEEIAVGATLLIPGGGLFQGIRAGAHGIRALSRAIFGGAGRAAATSGAAKAAATAPNSGIYVINSTSGVYVGQSGNISRRLAQHVKSGKFTQAEVDKAARVAVQGGKLQREIAEQVMIDRMGGIGNLLNLVNPIGPKRFSLMPFQPYVR